MTIIESGYYKLKLSKKTKNIIIKDQITSSLQDCWLFQPFIMSLKYVPPINAEDALIKFVV